LSRRWSGRDRHVSGHLECLLGKGGTKRAAVIGIAATTSLLVACTGRAGRMESGFTESGLYYEVSGQGMPVVLLHGFSLDRRVWEGQVRILEPHFRVVRYDLRGHGRSAAITAPYTAHGDLAAVLDALHIERAALVGHSAGAQIALDFALVYPERVTALVLAAPGLSGYTPSEPSEWMNPMAEAMRSGDMERAVTLWTETPLMAIPQEPAADSVMRTIVRDNADIWSANPTFQQPLEPPAIGRLAAVRVPTLVLVGDADLREIHKVADTLATCIAGARQESIANAGHMLNLAAPESFNAAVLAFLRNAAPSSQPFRSPCQ